jgi:hypothetical protein
VLYYDVNCFISRIMNFGPKLLSDAVTVTSACLRYVLFSTFCIFIEDFIVNEKSPNGIGYIWYKESSLTKLCPNS